LCNSHAPSYAISLFRFFPALFTTFPPRPGSVPLFFVILDVFFPFCRPRCFFCIFAFVFQLPFFGTPFIVSLFFFCLVLLQCLPPFRHFFTGLFSISPPFPPLDFLWVFPGPLPPPLAVCSFRTIFFFIFLLFGFYSPLLSCPPFCPGESFSWTSRRPLYFSKFRGLDFPPMPLFFYLFPSAPLSQEIPLVHPFFFFFPFFPLFVPRFFHGLIFSFI